MDKELRQLHIRKIIRRHEIHTQEELAAELQKRGIRATQVTLSRDLREMDVVKASDGYQEIGSIDDTGMDADLSRAVEEFLRDVRQAQNLLVLRTDPGSANAVAVALDHAKWPEVVGTIAGDDTVLVITPDARTAKGLVKKLEAV